MFSASFYSRAAEFYCRDDAYIYMEKHAVDAISHTFLTIEDIFVIISLIA